MKKQSSVIAFFAAFAASLVILITGHTVFAAESSPTVTLSSTGANKITVSWTSVSEASSYNVYRCSKTAAYQKIATVSGTSYTDTSVENDTPYEYSVTAVVNGTETPFRNKGTLGYTAYKAPHIYNWQVKDLTPWSFTVSGKISYAGSASVLHLPVWTEANGQDDLKWYTVAISNNSFSYTVYTSNHGSQRGVYVLDPYLNGTSIYLGGPMWVEVPVGQITITSPGIVNLSKEGFTATAIAKAFNNHVKNVKAEIWTAYRGTDDLETVTASYDETTGVVSCPVNVSRHHNESELYYVRFTVTDGVGGSKSLLLSAYVPTTQKCMALTVIDLGEGNIGGSASLLTSGGKGLLIDSGRSESADAVIAALKQHKLTSVDLIITHGDGDHVGVAQAIIDAGISIGNVYTDQYPSDCMWDELDRRNSIAVFKKYGTVKGITSSLTIGDATLNTVGPVRHYSLYDARSQGVSQANANSYWFMITNGSRKILINGDAEIIASNDMVQSGRDIAADLFILSHHGAVNSLNAGLLKAISPVWTAASGRITSAISSDTVQKLKDAGVPYYFTSSYGSIDFSFRGRTVTINTEKNTDAPAVYYSVTWKNADGVVLEKDSYVKDGAAPSYDGSEPALLKTAQYTYTFAGWSTDGKTVLSEMPAVTADTVFIAVYHSSLNYYQISWKNVDESLLGVTTAAYGTIPEPGLLPAYPAHDTVLYTFNGWKPELQAVRGKAVYTATYAASSPKVRRLYGRTRFETSNEILNESTENGVRERLLLTSGTSFQYAIAGMALAGAYDCPLLITTNKFLYDATREEITRLCIENCEVMIIGDENVVSQETEAALLEMAEVASVIRIAGETSDVSEAALRIYENGLENHLWTETGTVVIACGNEFADAASIAPYARAEKTPLFFTDETGEISEAVYEALFSNGTSRAILAGGTGVVSKTVEDRLNAAGILCVRLGGANRFLTSKKVLEWMTGLDSEAAFQPEEVFSLSHIGFASGMDFADAVTSANLLGIMKSPVLLVGEYTVSVEVLFDVLAGHEDEVQTAYIFGGSGAVSEDLGARIADAVTKDIF